MDQFEKLIFNCYQIKIQQIKIGFLWHIDRVGLARAIYARADLYILDDPLAAVDPAVASQIYKNCVQGILKTKTRILITHQYQFLTDADNILYLDGGKQLEYGNFEKVMSHSKFIQSLKRSNDESDGKKVKNKSQSLLSIVL